MYTSYLKSNVYIEMKGCFTASVNVATILSELSSPRSHKKHIFELKTESRWQLNAISRNISVDTAPISIALGECLVFHTCIFSSSLLFPTVTFDLFTILVKWSVFPKPVGVSCMLSDNECDEQSCASSPAEDGVGLMLMTELSWIWACLLIAECVHWLYITIRPQTILIWKLNIKYKTWVAVTGNHGIVFVTTCKGFAIPIRANITSRAKNSGTKSPKTKLLSCSQYHSNNIQMNGFQWKAEQCQWHTVVGYPRECSINNWAAMQMYGQIPKPCFSVLNRRETKAFSLVQRILNYKVAKIACYAEPCATRR